MQQFFNVDESDFAEYPDGTDFIELFRGEEFVLRRSIVVHYTSGMGWYVMVRDRPIAIDRSTDGSGNYRFDLLRRILL